MISPEKPDPGFIQRMFDGLAPRYDLFNHLTSMGMAGRWRREALAPVQKGMRVLDLGCGTGDLALEAIQKMGPGAGEVVGLDFSNRMLEVARRRYEKRGYNGHRNFRLVQKKAEDLPFEEAPYDLVVSGFVLRNLYENIDRILLGVRRSLKEGGAIRFLDITEPENGAARFIWKFYMRTLAALYGKVLFGDGYPSSYLTDSAARFPRAGAFVKKLEEAGFKHVRSRAFMLGSVTLYEAEK
ncbi:MAG: ubiquinone/menaquinone biosynthesis methyltransferase [Candidatus Omnitrophota bacterium]